MTPTRWLPTSFVLFFSGLSLAASIPLEPHAAASFTVGMPRSWTVVEDAPNGLLVARQNAGRDDSASVLFLFKPGATNRTEDQLLDSVSSQFAKNLVVHMREALPGGGHQMVADGVSGAMRMRVGVIALVINGTSVVSLLTAKPADFEGLGGMELVTSMLASLKVRGASAAPAPSPSAQPAPATGASGKLDVPPPARPLTVADLAGEWSNDDGVITNYVNYRGDYSGYQSIAIRDKWVFDGRGGVSSAFTATTAGQGGVRQVNEKKTGAVTLTRNTILTLGWNGAAQPSYLIRGWREMQGMTVLLLNGPWYGQVPADVIADRSRGTNLDSYWVRKGR